MARFLFKLEALLKQRKRIEQQAQRELAVRLAVLVEAEDALKRMDEGVRAAADHARAHHLVGQIDLNFLAAHRRFMNAMQRRALVQAQVIAQAKARVDEARGALAGAARDRKAIEKLKENQLARWKHERQKAETEEQDEVGMQIGYANLADPSDNV